MTFNPFGPWHAFWPVEGSTMREVELRFFFGFGAWLSHLVPPPPDRETTYHYAVSVRKYIDIFLDEYAGVERCRDAGLELADSIKVIEKWHEGKTPQQRAMAGKEVNRQFAQVVRNAKTFQFILENELKFILAYEPTQKLAYSTSILVQHAELVFPETVRSKLSKEVVFEIRESGKCLVFDIPTAAGFHILRATESVMHEYYLVVCKPATKKRLTSWAAYTTALYNQSTKGVVDEETREHIKRSLALLHQVKEDRNLLMHPEVVLGTDEALILFDIAKSIITTMVEKLPKKRQRG